MPRMIERMSTAMKLLVALSLALLPIGAITILAGLNEVNNLREAARGEARGQMISAVRSIDALIGRNALAQRVAANGALSEAGTNPCERAASSLEITPGVARQFSLTDGFGDPICGERVEAPDDMRALEAGQIAVWVDPSNRGIYLRVGVVGGSATGLIDVDELRGAVSEQELARFSISDGTRSLALIDEDIDNPNVQFERIKVPAAGGRLDIRMADNVSGRTPREFAFLALPLLMWLAAVLVGLAVVNRLLLKPLKRLRDRLQNFEPGEEDFTLPTKLGPAKEIRDLGHAFNDAFGRLEESENAMGEALEGQRLLVREVHHRVKNNLQVVASLLNIHSRSASGDEAKDAYAGIGRRVEALAVVHRNHFAEVEESRGIQMRPLLTELAAGLRASAVGVTEQRLIELDVQPCSTTQDTAVAAAFLVTEIVEHVLNAPEIQPIEIELKRIDELTARLSIRSRALAESDDDLADHVQFERIVDGLARQLRSPLDKGFGTYAVNLPIFPEEY